MTRKMDRDEAFSRQDVRVKVYFPIRWTGALDPGDLAEEIRSHRSCDRFTTPPTAFTDLPTDLADLTEFQEMSPHIYSMWMSIERRLDHVIRLLSQKVFDAPEMERGYCLNLSAGGALLRLMEKPERGQKLLVRMNPPTFPLFILEIIAVAKSVAPDAEKGGGWLVSVEFEAINDQDREDLITYIFKRQREILRSKSG